VRERPIPSEMRGVSLQAHGERGKGGADQRAPLLQRSRMSRRHGLGHDVPERGCFRRPWKHRSSRGLRGEPVQEIVPGASPDDVKLIHGPARAQLDAVESPGVLRSRAFKDTPRNFPRTGGLPLTRLRAVPANPFRHRISDDPGLEEPGVVHVNCETAWRNVFRQTAQLVIRE
jgi:hypothetical protein